MFDKTLKSNKDGFTLIEVLIAVAIIALLILLAFFSYQSQISKGRDSERKTDLHRIGVAVEEYEKDNNCYPLTLPSCGTDEFRPYIPIIPCDPLDKGDYFYVPEPDTACPEWYWVFVDLEKEDDTDSEELGCTVGCGPTADTADYEYYVSSPNAPAPEVAASGYFGCKNGICVELQEEGECSPNYGNFSECKQRCDSDPDKWECLEK